MSDAAYRDAPLTDQAAGVPERAPPDVQPPAAWVAWRIACDEAGPLVYAASSERRADEIGRALRQFAPEVEVLVLPPWDCLPYDRASPSRECMGRRMAVLRRLATPPAGRRVLVAAVEALMQRVPPPAVAAEAAYDLARGEPIDLEALAAFAARTGYVVDDRVDEPGEIAFQGEVVDVFPAAEASPFRLTVADGRLEAIRTYDPLSQRTEGELAAATLGPASELILDAEAERDAGAEHRAPAVYGGMTAPLDLWPDAPVALDPKARSRAASFAAQVLEAHEARASFPDGERPLAPHALYLHEGALQSALEARAASAPDPRRVEVVPNFALSRNPGRAFSDYVQARLAEGAKVAATGLPHELRALSRALEKGLKRRPEPVASLQEVAEAGEGALLAAPFDLDAGYADSERGVVLIAAADVLGGRLAKRDAGAGRALLAEPELRVGDVVIHEDHGLGVLRALERVQVAGAERDALRLEYHGGASLLAPVEEFGRIWRYGAEPESVTLDRLNTDAWFKRRAAISAEIDRTAAHLVALAKVRENASAPVLSPPRAEYARFAARFPYPETPDQAAAIDAVLADLASGRPMNRLVCGDVGFGKTEVALRAAAAVALAGKQVAMVAPTTVLARQHYQSFRRRFAGTGVEVEQLSRLVSGSDAKETRARLADGSARIVVGTHAVASEHVRFADLGLVIIDEEQRFGAKLKQRLRDLASDGHVLTMSATPIPRTLQNALVGVEDVSVIATPPSRRRPIRTFLAPFDPATVRTALLRERRRGGQSFVVVPRIEDIELMAEQLGRLTPELRIRIAHGELAAETVDEAMVAFADGDGDVLLATNIIESGLDVPRANTMLIWRADRFGLAQLHQLRGRVGRGRTQGVAYLFTDPAEETSEATRSRLSTLEAFDRLGSGLAISARDLDIRGGGDLAGEDQAGHMQTIGLGLYQRLLTAALKAARGEDAGPDWTPELNLGVNGSFPDGYVADAGVRINLYARLARLTDAEQTAAFAEEVEDRFGPPPAEVQTLFDLARVSAKALELGVRRVDAGPKAVALTLEPDLLSRADAAGEGEIKGDRLIIRSPDPQEQTSDTVEAVLDRLGAALEDAPPP